MSVRSDIAALDDAVAVLDRIAAAEPGWLATLPEVELTRALLKVGSVSVRCRRARVAIGQGLDVVDQQRRERAS